MERSSTPPGLPVHRCQAPRQCSIHIISLQLLENAGRLLRVLFLDHQGHISAKPHYLPRAEALLLAASGLLAIASAAYCGEAAISGELDNGGWICRVGRVHFIAMLTGSDLLAKVKELGDVSKSELVRECGYVSSKKDGGERLNFTAFYEALLEAKGVSLGDGKGSTGGKGGRKLSYIATVQGNGNLLVGKAYTALLGLEPGDEFELKLGRKQIKLIPAGGADEEG